jgi:hypothetical protein
MERSPNKSCQFRNGERKIIIFCNKISEKINQNRQMARLLEKSKLKYELYFSNYIVPMAKKRLELWHKRASQIKKLEKANFACKTIENKIKHPIATSAFVSSLPFSQSSFLLDKYIALSLLLDYLDDVIDRGNEHDPIKIAKMQQAMVDALKPKEKQLSNYPSSEMLDLSYLKDLVKTASEKITSLPIYSKSSPYIIKSMEDFIKTQIHSALPLEKNKILAKEWAEKSFAKEFGLTWFEHQAVQASPLRAYALLWASTKFYITENQLKMIDHAYIWMGGINVLGDQINDLECDKLNGEVNQIIEYKNEEKVTERILEMVKNASEELDLLPNRSFHQFILTALINLYMQPLLKTKWHKVADILCRKFSVGKNFIRI